MQSNDFSPDAPLPGNSPVGNAPLKASSPETDETPAQGPVKRTMAWLHQKRKKAIEDFGILEILAGAILFVLGWLFARIDSVRDKVFELQGDQRASKAELPQMVKNEFSAERKELQEDLNTARTTIKNYQTCSSLISTLLAQRCAGDLAPDVRNSIEEFFKATLVESLPVDLRRQLYYEVAAAYRKESSYHLFPKERILELTHFIRLDGVPPNDNCGSYQWYFSDVMVLLISTGQSERARNLLVATIDVLRPGEKSDTHDVPGSLLALLFCACLFDEKPLSQSDRLEFAWNQLFSRAIERRVTRRQLYFALTSVTFERLFKAVAVRPDAGVHAQLERHSRCSDLSPSGS